MPFLLLEIKGENTQKQTQTFDIRLLRLENTTNYMMITRFNKVFGVQKVTSSNLVRPTNSNRDFTQCLLGFRAILPLGVLA